MVEAAPKRRRKLLVVLLLSAVAVSVGVATGFYFHKLHKTRYLRDVDARLNIDDREGAIKALQEHLLSYPGDFEQQIRLGILTEQVGNLESAERIFRRVIAQSPIDTQVHSLASSRVGSIINDRVEVLVGEGDLAMKAGEYERAADLYTQVIALFEDHPSYSWATLATLELKPESVGKVFSQYSLHFLDYNDAIASRAFALWKTGEEGLDLLMKFPGPLGTMVSLSSDQGQEKREHLQQIQLLHFSDLLAEHALELFESKLYSEAGAAWESAQKYRSMSLGGECDEECARFLFNQAVAENNQGNHQTARNLLQELAEGYPEYDQDRVQGFIADTRTQSVAAGYNRLRRIAESAFEEERWLQAVSAYNDCAEYLLKQGYPESHGLVAQSRYNIAMACINNGDHNDAVDILTMLQNTAPDYEPFLVRKQLEDAKELSSR